MRLKLIAAVIAGFLFASTTLVQTQASTRQQRRYHLRALRPQWNWYGRSNSKEHARSANDAVDNTLQSSADTGRGFMAKWMMLKSKLQQPTEPPVNNIIVVTAPESSPTTTTTTLITSPTTTTPTTSSITTPTTTTTTNSTRSGHLTQIVYGRGDNNDEGTGIVRQKGQFENSATSGGPNKIPTMKQYPHSRRRIHSGQLNRNKQKRRLQQKRKMVLRPNRNAQVKRRRMPMQAVAANRKQQHKTLRRKIVRPSNQNRIGNRNDNFAANTPDGKVDFINNDNDGAVNNLDTNARLQHVMNGLRHPQTPFVYNY